MLLKLSAMDMFFKTYQCKTKMPNNFRTGSEKLPNIALYLKIFSRFISARTEQKPVS
jgi:hypothetical protein